MGTELSEVTSADWQLSLYEDGELVQGAKDVAQCIDIILNTHLGSDPMRPDFGTRWLDNIDLPINIAAPRMLNEIIRAIERWEPRVVIDLVTYQVDEAKITYQINWTSSYGKGVNIIPL